MWYNAASRWSSVRTRFRRADIWLIIAILALAGWTVDAMRMYLSMHDTLWAGFRAWSGHFWYVIPVAITLMVLPRLPPRARLLGTAVYDEGGRLLHRRGDFYPDDLLVNSMLMSLHEGDQPGAHSIHLPSGARVYFVRVGGRTLLLSFSHPATVEDLQGCLQELRPDLSPSANLLDGLEPHVAALAATVMHSPVKREVLHFLHQHNRLTIRPRDLAFRIGSAQDEATWALEEFVTLGLVEGLEVCGEMFYRLKREEAVERLLDKLCDWQEQWHTQLRRIEDMVGSRRE